MKDFVSQIYRHKTLGRILFNRAVRRHANHIEGKTLDLASGKSPSYLVYLPQATERVIADITTDKPIDMDNRFPFLDGEFNTVLFFNALYIAKDPEFTFSEIRRVLAPGGTLLMASPFLQPEMPEPHDYRRYTAEGIQVLAEQAGFEICKVEYLGGRWSVATNLLHNFWFFDTVRMAVYGVALWLDRCTSSLQKRHRAPILYFVIAK